VITNAVVTTNMAIGDNRVAKIHTGLLLRLPNYN